MTNFELAYFRNGVGNRQHNSRSREQAKTATYQGCRDVSYWHLAAPLECQHDGRYRRRSGHPRSTPMSRITRSGHEPPICRDDTTRPFLTTCYGTVPLSSRIGIDSSGNSRSEAPRCCCASVPTVPSALSVMRAGLKLVHRIQPKGASGGKPNNCRPNISQRCRIFRMLNLNCYGWPSGARCCNMDYPSSPLFSSDVYLRCSTPRNCLVDRGI